MSEEPSEPAEIERLRLANELIPRVRYLLLGHHDGELMEVPNVWGRLALQTYARTRSLFEATVTLVEARHPEEAFMLVRELLVDSLRLMELAARPADRMALSFG